MPAECLLSWSDLSCIVVKATTRREQAKQENNKIQLFYENGISQVLGFSIKYELAMFYIYQVAML